MEEKSKARSGRATSNVFAKMSKKLMQEMKEAIKAKQDEPKKAQRATSNVFAMFRQAQVQEFKETGIIDIEDLKDIYSNLGRIPPDDELKEMLKEAPGPLNFTMFLNLFGEKLSGK
nr:hypothetical protein BaRGS_013404 [Batillaria attramentaria]